MSAGAQPSEVPVVVDDAVGGDVGARSARGPALVVDGDWVERHVRVGVLDVNVEHGDVAAQAHRPDAGLVQQPGQLLLELRDQRILVLEPTGRAIASFARCIA